MTWVNVQKIGQMMKISIRDLIWKIEQGDISFFFRNWQSVHKKLYVNIEKISMLEVFSSMSLNMMLSSDNIFKSMQVWTN